MSESIKKSNFPVLTHLSQVREAIEKTREKVGKSFFESTKDGLVYFSYRFFTSSTFPDPKKASSPKMAEYYRILRECRGIVFDEKTGKCVSRSFHKFFNINGEAPECDQKYIDLSQKHVWLEKLDGSMVCAIAVSSGKGHVIRFRTKMGFQTEVAEKIEKFVYKTDNKIVFVGDEPSGKIINAEKDILLFCNKWIQLGYTPIFEFVSPLNQIVLPYNETKLICLSIRKNLDGSYVSYEDLAKECKDFQIQCVRSYDLGSDMDRALKFISGMKNIEGFVLRMESDDMYKVKCEWYKNLHKSDSRKLLFGHVDEKRLWELILENEMDDMTAVLNKDGPQRKILEDFTEELWRGIQGCCKKMMDYIAKKPTYRKQIHTWNTEKSSWEPMESKLYQAIQKGEDPIISLTSIVKDELALNGITPNLRRVLGIETSLEKELDLKKKSNKKKKKKNGQETKVSPKEEVVEKEVVEEEIPMEQEEIEEVEIKSHNQVKREKQSEKKSSEASKSASESSKKSKKKGSKVKIFDKSGFDINFKK